MEDRDANRALGAPPDMQTLALDWIALWQSELNAAAADRELQLQLPDHLGDERQRPRDVERRPLEIEIVCRHTSLNAAAPKKAPNLEAARPNYKDGGMTPYFAAVAAMSGERRLARRSSSSPSLAMPLFSSASARP